MSIKIFTITHKKFQEPADSTYVPLHVGRKNTGDLGYQGDHTEDNISDKNCYYSELTGVYWIWKNVHDTDYVGICHYRRYFLNQSGKLMKSTEYEEILEDYDIITSNPIYSEGSNKENYANAHNLNDLLVTGQVIQKLTPEYYPEFCRLLEDNVSYFGNLMVTSKEKFDQYAAWLFPIFEEVEKHIHPDEYDEYHRRVFGFLSEYLLKVWIDTNKLKVYECNIGITAEKAETTEVKEKVAEYLKKQDIAGLKEYFVEYMKHRPDVMLELSDLKGELQLIPQIIYTYEEEIKEGSGNILDYSTDFRKLTEHIKKINEIVVKLGYENDFEEGKKYLTENHVSYKAVEISAMIMIQERDRNALS